MSSARALLELSPALSSLDGVTARERLLSLQEALEADRAKKAATKEVAEEAATAAVIKMLKEAAHLKTHADAAAVGARVLLECACALSFPSDARSVLDVSKAMLVKSTSSKTSAAGIELMRGCFSRWPGSACAAHLDPLRCQKLLEDVIVHSSKHTPTVIRQANWCLGALCK